MLIFVLITSMCQSKRISIPHNVMTSNQMVTKHDSFVLPLAWSQVKAMSSKNIANLLTLYTQTNVTLSSFGMEKKQTLKIYLVHIVNEIYLVHM